jgi:hypothetical protein
LLDGTMVDTYLKGYFARDWSRRKRLMGLLAPVFYKNPSFDYSVRPDPLWADNLTPAAMNQIMVSSERLYRKALRTGRESPFEWMEMYPFSDFNEGALWAAQRRVLPIRVVAMDNRLLDFAFRCPVRYKLDRRLIVGSARELLGPAGKIPTADQGIWPAGSRATYLAQRLIRKSEDFLARLRPEQTVQHSWHDYQSYWRNSKGLTDLIDEHGENLACLSDTVVRGDAAALLRERTIRWECGFRLLQVAIWLSCIGDYRGLEGHISRSRG